MGVLAFFIVTAADDESSPMMRSGSDRRCDFENAAGAHAVQRHRPLHLSVQFVGRNVAEAVLFQVAPGGSAPPAPTRSIPR
jgi:hypothetical protein